VIPANPPAASARGYLWLVAAGAAAVVVALIVAAATVLPQHSSPPNGAGEHALPALNTVPAAGVGPMVGPDRLAGGVVITHALANQIVRAYWPRHERSLVDHNLPDLAKLSDAAGRRWEQAAVACGCLNVLAPRPLLSVTTLVPRQTRYPASFVGEAATEVSGTNWTETLVFTKQRAGKPWLVTEDSGFGPPPGVRPESFAPVVDPAGFDAPVSAATLARAARVAARFANVWQQAKDTGTIPDGTGFDLTGDTGRRVAYLAAYPQGSVQANGLIGRFHFTAASSYPLVVTNTVEGALACRPTDESVVYTPARPGGAAIQNQSRTNWGPELAPGVYPEIIDHDVWQTCFVIPSNSALPIGVLDQDVGGGLSAAPSRTT
jgi:hypothetical protein